MYANIRISSVYLYLLIVLNSGEKNDSTFVPTREWQVVKTGTSIPAGLHVRHNFQTGVTEAKLMDHDETKDANSSISSDDPLTKSLTLHPDQILLQPNGDESVRVRNNHIPQMITFPVDELKNHLKNIKQNNVTRDFGAKHKMERTEKQNSSYTDLKKKFEAESHSVKITNDAELLKRYFQKFEMHKTSITTDVLTIAETKDVLDILSNIEYLIHQFENAHMFTDTNGMAAVILPCINSTNNEIKTKALQLLGAAAQSNSKVQTKALESGFVQMILHILYTNRELKVKTKCLFALSALIRHFPLAQKTFIDHSGPEIFAKILADDRLEIQVRVLRLISDLAIEREDLKRIDDPEQRQKQMEDYSGTRFEDKLLTHCCQHLSKLLIARFMQVSSDQLNTENYAFLEAISESAVILYPMCKDKCQSDKDQLVIAINNILKMCVNLIITADTDETDRLKDLQLILEKLKTVVNVPHDEL